MATSVLRGNQCQRYLHVSLSLCKCWSEERLDLIPRVVHSSRPPILSVSKQQQNRRKTKKRLAGRRAYAGRRGGSETLKYNLVHRSTCDGYGRPFARKRSGENGPAAAERPPLLHTRTLTGKVIREIAEGRKLLILLKLEWRARRSTIGKTNHTPSLPLVFAGAWTVAGSNRGWVIVHRDPRQKT